MISTFVGTISVATEPCDGKWGKYDMPACDFCAHSGKAHGECCNGIYGNSLGRDEFATDDEQLSCIDLKHDCHVGAG